MSAHTPLLVAAACCAALTGCSSADTAVSEIAGFGIGAAVGAATGNPFIAVGVGLAARVAFDEGLRYYLREEQDAVHDAIASVAGAAEVGDRRLWSVRSNVPFVDTGGSVQVLREFGEEIPCREIVFSDRADRGRWFVAVICKGDQGWRWAVSAPSTKRWEGFQ